MNNPLQFVRAFRNPQEFMSQAMNNNQIMQNPLAKNVFEKIQNGDTKGLEEMGRNLCKENGIDADEALKQVKSMFGM